MEIIKDFIGDITNIIQVIDGTKINAKMIENILSIYIDEELKDNLIKLLTRYENLFNGMQNIKPGTFIVGPYSSGKSHVALFISFLFGYFADSTEFKSIRRYSWDIIDDSLKNLIDTARFQTIRNKKFISIYINLNNYLKGQDILSIIIDQLNNKLEDLNIKKKIGIDFTQRNVEIIENLIKDPIELEIYKNASSDLKKEILIETAKKNDLVIKRKSSIDFAEEIGKIVSENNFEGVIIFLDEFYRYYDLLDGPMRKFVAGIIQNFYEVIEITKICLFPISQIDLFDKDDYLKQVERRFEIFGISYKNSTEIMHHRLIPNKNIEKISNYYNNSFKLFKNRRIIDYNSFITYYPFLQKTIESLKNFVGYYANDNKGILSYSSTALYNSLQNSVHKLITADTLFDYFILQDRESPNQTGYELKQHYLEIKREFIDKIIEKDKRDLTSKILKILLFCTNRIHSWTLEDFYRHFFDYNNKQIDKIIFDLIDFIESRTNFIKTNLERNVFFYDPGISTDLKTYIKLIDGILKEDKILNRFKQEFSYIDENDIPYPLEFRNTIEKFYRIKLIEEISHGELEKNINYFLKNNYVSVDDIISYIEDDDYCFISLVIIDNNFKSSESDTEKIKSFYTTYFKKQDKEKLDSLNNSILITIPPHFTKKKILRIKKYYIGKILKSIFQVVKKFREYADIRKKLQSKKILPLIDETLFQSKYKLFLKEKEENIDSYINIIDNLLKSKDYFDPNKNNLVVNSESLNVMLNSTLLASEIGILKKNGNEFQLSWGKIKPSYKTFKKFIEDQLSSFIEKKYNILAKLIIQKTKKFTSRTVTIYNNKLISNLFLEKYEIKITDNVTQQILDSTFRELGIITRKKNKLGYFNFNPDFLKNNNQYYKPLVKFLNSIHQNKRIIIKHILSEYTKPPYGFPIIITLWIILSLIHAKKYCLEISYEKKYQFNNLIEFYKNDKRQNSFKTKTNDIIEFGSLIPLKQYSQENLFKIQQYFENILYIYSNDINSNKNLMENIFPESIYKNYIKMIKNVKKLDSETQKIMIKFYLSIDFKPIFSAIKYLRDYNNYIFKLLPKNENLFNLKKTEIEEYLNSSTKIFESLKNDYIEKDNFEYFLQEIDKIVKKEKNGKYKLIYKDRIKDLILKLRVFIDENKKCFISNFDAILGKFKLIQYILNKDEKYSNFVKKLKDIFSNQEKYWSFITSSERLNKVNQNFEKIVSNYQKKYILEHNEFWKNINDINSILFLKEDDKYSNLYIDFLTKLENIHLFKSICSIALQDITKICNYYKKNNLIISSLVKNTKCNCNFSIYDNFILEFRKNLPLVIKVNQIDYNKIQDLNFKFFIKKSVKCLELLWENNNNKIVIAENAKCLLENLVYSYCKSEKAKKSSEIINFFNKDLLKNIQSDLLTNFENLDIVEQILNFLFYSKKIFQLLSKNNYDTNTIKKTEDFLIAIINLLKKKEIQIEINNLLKINLDIKSKIIIEYNLKKFNELFALDEKNIPREFHELIVNQYNLLIKRFEKYYILFGKNKIYFDEFLKKLKKYNINWPIICIFIENDIEEIKEINNSKVLFFGDLLKILNHEFKIYLKKFLISEANYYYFVNKNEFNLINFEQYINEDQQPAFYYYLEKNKIIEIKKQSNYIIKKSRDFI